MGLCVKCNRVLAANGSCLYCGTMMGAEAVENQRRASGGRLRKILLRILYLSVAGLVAHFLLFTEPGKGLIQKIRGAVGL